MTSRSKNLEELILMFNRKMKLVGITDSKTHFSEITGAHYASILKAIRGEIVNVQRLYIRTIPYDKFIQMSSDLFNMTLEEFDIAMGNNDKLYKNDKTIRKKTKCKRSK